MTDISVIGPKELINTECCEKLHHATKWVEQRWCVCQRELVYVEYTCVG